MNMDSKAITTMRLLIAEGVQKAKSGHPGLAIGSSPMAYTLWKQMKHNPQNPTWAGRDRFVLSAGHASMLEYSLLHLFGYGLSIDDLKSFRQWNSRTPGHPEFGHTKGVESTSGPLGQGIATAVGMAMAEAHLSAVFNRDGFPVVDNYTYVISGDGCLMEGVASEAASMAATMKLGKLILLYDRNCITIEGKIDIAFTEDVGGRFAAYGWQVQELADGEDTAAIAKAIDAAKAETEKPSIIIVNTTIAYGSPMAGSPAAHGEPLGEENIKAMKQFFGWEYDEAFVVPEDVQAHFAALQAGYSKLDADYAAMFTKYRETYPELADQWNQWHSKELPEGILSDERLWNVEGANATRNISGNVLNVLAEYMPNLFGGSADLAPSNKTEMKGRGYFSPENYAGANIHFGIREFAMACAANGMALYGGLTPYCATFLVFSDYLKPALRLSALMHLPVLYVLTHDSIGVGEDGPTHQPIEHYAALRATPDTLFFRPADAKETAASYVAALTHDMPSVFALTRQNLPQYAETSKDALKGGYVLQDGGSAPDVVLMASGSEVELIYKAAATLKEQGINARVVSMPCMELFDMQDAAYKQSVLPASLRARVAVEAASSFGWHKYVGLDGEVIGLDHFGASAPAGTLFKEFGFTVENVVATALKVMGK